VALVLRIQIARHAAGQLDRPPAPAPAVRTSSRLERLKSTRVRHTRQWVASKVERKVSIAARRAARRPSPRASPRRRSRRRTPPFFEVPQVLSSTDPRDQDRKRWSLCPSMNSAVGISSAAVGSVATRRPSRPSYFSTCDACLICA
jgi:hypothetical protein